MTARRLAAILGFLGVTLGAFGAHGLEKALPTGDPALAAEALDWWQTAVLYHLVHAAALLASAGGDARRPPGAVGWCFAAGVAVFSGTLYAMALGAPTWFGAITPLGGLLLLAAWLLLLGGRG